MQHLFHKKLYFYCNLLHAYKKNGYARSIMYMPRTILTHCSDLWGTQTCSGCHRNDSHHPGPYSHLRKKGWESIKSLIYAKYYCQITYSKLGKKIVFIDLLVNSRYCSVVVLFIHANRCQAFFLYYLTHGRRKHACIDQVLV